MLQHRPLFILLLLQCWESPCHIDPDPPQPGRRGSGVGISRHPASYWHTIASPWRVACSMSTPCTFSGLRNMPSYCRSQATPLMSPNSWIFYRDDECCEIQIFAFQVKWRVWLSQGKVCMCRNYWGNLIVIKICGGFGRLQDDWRIWLQIETVYCVMVWHLRSGRVWSWPRAPSTGQLGL